MLCSKARGSLIWENMGRQPSQTVPVHVCLSLTSSLHMKMWRMRGYASDFDSEGLDSQKFIVIGVASDLTAASELWEPYLIWLSG